MNNLVIICAILLLALLFLKVSVYIVVLSVLAVYFVGTPGTNLSIFAQKTIGGVEGLSLLAIPSSVCAGISMNYTDVIKRIVSCCEVLTARMSGGSAQVNILLSTLTGGLSGSSLADAAMQCKMLIPTMESEGYSESLSTVITAAFGMAVPLIPPGVGLIIYGCINNISVGKPFVAGIGPGTVLCVILTILTHFLPKKRGYLPSRVTKIPVFEKIAAARPAFLSLLLSIIIIGGVRVDVFTASGAGTVTVVYAVLLGLLYKEPTLKSVTQGCKETVTTTASTMLTVAAATCSSWILTKEQIPQQLLQWMISNIHNEYVFLITVSILLLIIDMFVEGNVSMIVLAPLLYPAAMACGIDDIRFAMVYIFSCTIGALIPPIGTLMSVGCGIIECSTKDLIKEAVPFYILFAIDVIALTHIPQLTTFFVNVFY